LGHEFWQSIDSTAASGVAAQILKYGFSRARPFQGRGPNQWPQGGSQSFPSDEVTLQAEFLTPIVLDESARGNLWVWALELLPLYDSIRRLKQQAHWQTDVLAGWALGTASGYWSAHRSTPLFVEILPRGVSVGFQKRFYRRSYCLTKIGYPIASAPSAIGAASSEIRPHPPQHTIVPNEMVPKCC